MIKNYNNLDNADLSEVVVNLQKHVQEQGHRIESL